MMMPGCAAGLDLNERFPLLRGRELYGPDRSGTAFLCGDCRFGLHGTILSSVVIFIFAGISAGRFRF